MLPLLEIRREAIAELCRRFHVKRLDVFGSAARDSGFDPERSDVNFLVSFQPMPPIEYGRAYFGLKEALEAMLGRDVDLVTEPSLRNPYFRQSIDASRKSLYAA